MTPRRVLDFKGVTIPTPPNDLVLGPLRITKAADSGEEIVFDFTDLPATRLVRELVTAFRDVMGGRRFARSTYAGSTPEARALRTFLELAVVPNELTDLGRLTRAHLDEYGRTLKRRLSPKSARQRMSCTLFLLSKLPEGRLMPEAIQRLHYSFEERAPGQQPIEAYSEYVAERLRSGCRRLVRASMRRLTIEAGELLARGHDPRLDGRRAPRKRQGSRNEKLAPGWTKHENLVWELNASGPCSRAELARRSGYASIEGSLPAHAAVFPTQRDLYPFWVLLQLETGMTPAGATTLTTGCLANHQNQRADLTYDKARASHRRVTRRVRDGNLFTPGGLIRGVLAITARLRAHVPVQDRSSRTALWIATKLTAASPGYVMPVFTNGGDISSPCAWLCEALDLRNDSGDRIVRLQANRLRKTYKALRAKRVKGQVRDFADGDHTPRVAVQHYANIEELRATYEQTVADGQRDALAAARRAGTVLTPEDEVAVLADPAPLAAKLSVPLPVIHDMLDGKNCKHDVFIAICANPLNSPYGRAGEFCPVVTWGCLPCRNAVYTSHKLPALLAFLAHMYRERAVLEADAWRLKYRDSPERITREILPNFRPAVVAEARVLASTYDLYLPPELRSEGGA